MNKGKLITLTGLDGAGKSSMLSLMKEYFESQGKKVKSLHFPMYGHSEFSDIITKFLKGEFGSINDVNALFISNIYAMDRYMYKKQLITDLQENDIVIIDRYVDCNVSFQCSKVEDKTEREDLKKWIYGFEYGFLKLPKPDMVLFLDVPINIIEKRLNSVREGEDRDYLDGGKDIHEQDITFQNKVRDIYLDISENIIKTIDEEGNSLTPIGLFESFKHML